MRVLTVTILVLVVLCLPVVAAAECRIVTVQGADGKYQTCQVFDHVVICS